jgi:SPASM domain peptide maturase of grasp-with-spasm system
LALVKELNSLGTESIVFIIKTKIDLITLLKLFIGTNISSISIYSLQEFVNPENTIKKINDPRLKSLFLLESASSRIEYTDTGKFVIYSTEKFDMIKGCGHISSDFFSLDILTYTESLHHNSCLNRKISIDAEGNIKNCPSMKESFGNIRDTTLAEAIEKPGFKKYWDINKDKIHVCKDCEFRYICTDCRAYVEDPEDIFSKPLKCGYNPYTGEWSEWSTNPLKQKAIDFYGMRDMVEDNKSEHSE